MNEIRERRKKQAIKVAITEGLMVVAVVLLVVSTTLVTVGYNVNVNDDISIERTGLVAVRSIPTGALIEVDGETIFNRTNMSRTMTEGEHDIVLTRDGYDSWTKKVNVAAGMYRRIDYPRLFLEEKKIEEVADFSNIDVFSVAPDENTMITIDLEKGEWKNYKINENKVVGTKIITNSVFLEKNPEKVEILSWSGNSERIICKIDGKIMIFNVKKPEESVNLTDRYGFEFGQVEFENDAGSKVIVLENGNLREISVDSGVISEPLVTGVEKFSNNREKIAYVTAAKEGELKKVGVFRVGEKGGVVIFETEEVQANVSAVVGEYFGDDYVGIGVDGYFSVMIGKLPNYGAEEVKMDVTYQEEAGFEIDRIESRGNGELLVAVNRDNTEMAVFDAETENVVKITTLSETEWVDEYLLRVIEGGKLSVFDFDGENKREIVPEGVRSGTEVRISRNERWMYYLREDGGFYRIKIGA